MENNNVLQKSECDNNCNTCNNNNRLFCTLMLIKGMKASVESMNARINAIEAKMVEESHTSLMPADSIVKENNPSPAPYQEGVDEE